VDPRGRQTRVQPGPLGFRLGSRSVESARPASDPVLLGRQPSTTGAQPGPAGLPAQYGRCPTGSCWAACPSATAVGFAGNTHCVLPVFRDDKGSATGFVTSLLIQGSNSRGQLQLADLPLAEVSLAPRCCPCYGFFRVYLHGLTCFALQVEAPRLPKAEVLAAASSGSPGTSCCCCCSAGHLHCTNIHVSSFSQDLFWVILVGRRLTFNCKALSSFKPQNSSSRLHGRCPKLLRTPAAPGAADPAL
jgi:hypothetical protein